MRIQTNEVFETDDSEAVLRALEMSLRDVSVEVVRQGRQITLRGLGPSQRTMNRNDVTVIEVSSKNKRTTIKVDVTYMASALLGGVSQDDIVRAKLERVFDNVKMQVGGKRVRVSVPSVAAQPVASQPVDTPSVDVQPIAARPAFAPPVASPPASAPRIADLPISAPPTAAPAVSVASMTAPIVVMPPVTAAPLAGPPAAAPRAADSPISASATDAPAVPVPRAASSVSAHRTDVSSVSGSRMAAPPLSAAPKAAAPRISTPTLAAPVFSAPVAAPSVAAESVTIARPARSPERASVPEADTAVQARLTSTTEPTKVSTAAFVRQAAPKAVDSKVGLGTPALPGSSATPRRLEYGETSLFQAMHPAAPSSTRPWKIMAAVVWALVAIVLVFAWPYVSPLFHRSAASISHKMGAQWSGTPESKTSSVEQQQAISQETALQNALVHNETDPKAWLESWAAAMRGKDAALQASFYADPVDRYFLKSNVSNASVLMDKQAAIEKREGLWTFKVEGVVVDQKPDSTAKVLLKKHVISLLRDSRVSERIIRSQLRLKRIDGHWKIVGEQNLR